MSEIRAYPDLFGSPSRAKGQLVERRSMFAFQATPVVQDVYTDEDDPWQTLVWRDQTLMTKTAIIDSAGIALAERSTSKQGT